MGGLCSKGAKGAAPDAEHEDVYLGGQHQVAAFKRPKWKTDQLITEQRLKAMREEFWDTQPHYGGDRVIWDALKAACEADLQTARLIIDSAGIIVAAEDMSVCYDARGAKYDIPKFVLSAPTNLVKHKGGGGGSGGGGGQGGGGQVQLTAGS